MATLVLFERDWHARLANRTSAAPRLARKCLSLARAAEGNVSRFGS